MAEMDIGEATRLHIALLGWAGPNDPAETTTEMALRYVSSRFVVQAATLMFLETSQDDHLGLGYGVGGHAGEIAEELVRECLVLLSKGDVARYLDAITEINNTSRAFDDELRESYGLIREIYRGARIGDPDSTSLDATIEDFQSLISRLFEALANNAAGVNELLDVHGSTRQHASTFASLAFASFMGFSFTRWMRGWQRALEGELQAEATEEESDLLCGSLAYTGGFTASLAAGAVLAQIATDVAHQMVVANDSATSLAAKSRIRGWLTRGSIRKALRYGDTAQATRLVKQQYDQAGDDL